MFIAVSLHINTRRPCSSVTSCSCSSGGISTFCWIKKLVLVAWVEVFLSTAVTGAELSGHVWGRQVRVCGGGKKGVWEGDANY